VTDAVEAWTTRALMRSDIIAANPNLAGRTGFAFWSRALAKTLIAGNVRVVLMYRVAHKLAGKKGGLPFALLLRQRGVRISGAELNPLAEVGPGLYFPHSVGAGFGAWVRIGANCRIHNGAIIGPQPQGHIEPQYVTIGDDVYIGTNAVIVGGVTIGDGASIGANATVVRDVEPYAVVAASPGRVVGKRDPSDVRM
jgi:serine O-acetyltransferase